MYLQPEIIRIHPNIEGLFLGTDGCSEPPVDSFKYSSIETKKIFGDRIHKFSEGLQEVSSRDNRDFHKKPTGSFPKPNIRHSRGVAAHPLPPHF